MRPPSLPPSLPPPQRERREREAEGERGSPRIKAERREERTENGPAAQRQTSNFQVSAPGSVEGLRPGLLIIDWLIIVFLRRIQTKIFLW